MTRLSHFSMKLPVVTFAFMVCGQFTPIDAGCCDHNSEKVVDSGATLIVEGRVTGKTSHRLPNRRIVTDVSIEIIEVFKGDASAPIIIRLPGGTVGRENEFCSMHHSLALGNDYIFKLIQKGTEWRCLAAKVDRAAELVESKRNKYRKARKARGLTSRRIAPKFHLESHNSSLEQEQSSGVTELPPQISSIVSASGYFNINGAPARFTTCDDGSAMKYLVDLEELPSGISQAQAMQAVEEALNAWSAASGLRFEHEGNVVFGQAASAIAASDQKLRIQLHDKYNEISSTSTLGIGGGGLSFSGTFPSGGIGGKIGSQEFQKRTRGYCVLNHRSGSMSTYTTFVEVLTHEIGHALGLRHSSESSGESDSYLEEAIMYYRVHGDARGASLGTYDVDFINYGYPALDMPPHGVDRIFYPITGSPQPTGIGVDRIRVSGGDQETPESLTAEILFGSASSNNGSFSSPDASTIVFTPAGVYSDFSLSPSQIAGSSAYDRIYYRISDGTNLSPHYSLRIVGMKRDTTPSDGLPNSWMNTHFSTTAVASSGQDHHPDSDPDSDGLSNRIEFIYGTDPNDGHSGKLNFVYNHTAGTTRWDTINYMPYILECSPNLSDWTVVRALEGTGSSTTIDLESATGDLQFYRVRLQP